VSWISHDIQKIVYKIKDTTEWDDDAGAVVTETVAVVVDTMSEEDKLVDFLPTQRRQSSA
jgi:hypothetical protein